MHKLFLENISSIKLVDEIILLPLGRGWGYKQADNGVQVLVYGSFRSDYKIITIIAEITADFYAETLFSPFVVPLKKKIWRDYLYKDKKFIKILHGKGIIAFSRLYHE